VTRLKNDNHPIYHVQGLKTFERIVYATSVSVMLSLLCVWFNGVDLLSVSALALHEWRILMLGLFITGTATLGLIVALRYATSRLTHCHALCDSGVLSEEHRVQLLFNTQLNTNHVYVSIGVTLIGICAALMCLDVGSLTNIMLLSTLGGCGWTLDKVGVLNESAHALSQYAIND
jgi:hypothetical protein